VISIPVLSTVLPVAWITGSDVYVDEIDETFRRSMATLQSEYKKNYPLAPFNTRIFAKSLVDGSIEENNSALLFSGGLDSTYSWYTNRDENPWLVMLFGTRDIPSSNIELQDMIKAEYSTFARREGLKLSFIGSNTDGIFDHNRLRHLWGKFQGINEGNFWLNLGFSLNHIGMVAPLSIGRFNKILYAATYGEAHSYTEYFEGSSPVTDEMITWRNLNVTHDGLLARYEKILAMKNMLENKRIKLRVCLAPPKYLLPEKALNCSGCEKCLRTIVDLAYAGIDPNECGFTVDNQTFELIKTVFEKRMMAPSYILEFWKPFQRDISEKEAEMDIYGSKKFFEWFKEQDLDSMGRKYHNPFTSLYFKLPYPISVNLRRIFETIKPVRYIEEPFNPK
jgi:hypothetical protein